MLTFAQAGMYNNVIMSEFERLLAENGWRKADLGRALGLTSTTISRWKDSPPEYALAYLRLRGKLIDAIEGGE